MNKSVFAKIIDREIPAEIVWENDKFIMILDINPIAKGHALLIPKVQVDKFYDLDDETYTELFRLTKLFAKEMEKTFKCVRTGIIIEGFGVPHVHVHLIPLDHGGIIETGHKYQPKEGDFREVGDLMRKSFVNIS